MDYLNSLAIGQAHAGGSSWGSPFLDMASLSMPNQHKNVLKWSEYVFDSHETYRMAQERIISYFLTDIEIKSSRYHKQLGDDEKDKWVKLLESMDVLSGIKDLDMDRAAYGNGFVSLMVPFKRMLVCPQCQSQFPLSVVYNGDEFNFHWSLPDFTATCPVCKTGSGYRGPWQVNDVPCDLETELKLKKWSPHEIEIVHDLYSDKCRYIWRIPEDYKRQLKEKNLHLLENVSMQVLRAVQNNNLFMFHPDALFHMREPVLSGRRHRGWGISRVLINFRQIFYVQVLRRYNEALGLDYIIPFRLLTPDSKSGGRGVGSDPLKTVGMPQFTGEVNRMLRQRRRDPAGWHFLPFDVKYHQLGGDASHLAPHELMDQAHDVLLNGSGVPPELYRGSLQLQTAPVALRLFEATHLHQVRDNDHFLHWLANQISQLLSWEMVALSMRSVTIADDFEKQMAMLQLMMGEMISRTTGLRGLGLDDREERRQIAEEVRRDQELQAEMQEEMEQAAFGEQIAKGQAAPPGAAGAPPPGGQGAPPEGDPAAQQQPGPVTGLLQSGTGPVSPQDMMAEAEAIAQQLLDPMMPETQRRSELRMLKQKNEFMHGLVKEKMEAIRSRARSVGGMMVLGQQ